MFKLDNIIYKDILDIEYLTISKNKVTTILGQSGSGKTTLLKLLNKIISPDSGKILYNDVLLSSIPSVTHRRNVVMLPQNAAIFQGTIKDNLEIALKYSQKPLASNKVLEDVLKQVYLMKSLNDITDTLSGGEKQRLALGRLILINPDVFLLDEPSSALDEETEENIIKSFTNYIHTTNKSLIMVTHSKNIAQNFSDCIIEIKNGKVVI